jgi:hypothetical protein
MSTVIDRDAERPRPVPWQQRLPAGSEKLVWIAVAIFLVGVGAVLWRLTRETSFWFDEWTFITTRRASNVAAFLDPYNGHFSLVPVALYKALFATASLRHYRPYLAMGIAGHLVCVLLLFLYARPRVGALLGLVAALSLALFGPGWQDILWPFQIAWLVVIAAALGILMLLERNDRRGDLGACALLMIALASQTAALPVAAGVAVEIAWVRRRWRDAWIVVVPLILYAGWWAGYQHVTSHGSVESTVRFVADAAAGTLSSVAGLSGIDVQAGTDSMFTFGAPLAVAAAALLVWLWHTGRVRSGRSLTVGVMLLGFWIVTGLARSDVTTSVPSRYLYVGAVFVLLLAIELARAVTIGPAVRGLIAVVALAAVVSNVGILRDASGFLRAWARSQNADLGAVNLSRGQTAPGVFATAFPGYPFIQLQAKQIYAAEDDLGQIGDAPSQLAAAPAAARHIADAEMVHVRALSLTPAVAAFFTGQPPVVDQVSGATASTSGSCVAYRAGVTGALTTSMVDLRLTAPRVWVDAAGSPAAVGLHRFGDPPVPLGSVPAGAAATLSIPADGAPQPWRLQITSGGRATVCSS